MCAVVVFGRVYGVVEKVPKQDLRDMEVNSIDISGRLDSRSWVSIKCAGEGMTGLAQF
jgi:hypothetical protein